MAKAAASLVALWQLPCKIAAAECSTKWKWLQKDINQPEVIVMAKAAVAVEATWQHSRATSSRQCRVKATAKKRKK